MTPKNLKKNQEKVLELASKHLERGVHTDDDFCAPDWFAETEQLLRFAQAIYEQSYGDGREQGYSEGYSSGYDASYYEHSGYCLMKIDLEDYVDYLCRVRLRNGNRCVARVEKSGITHDDRTYLVSMEPFPRVYFHNGQYTYSESSLDIVDIVRIENPSKTEPSKRVFMNKTQILDEIEKTQTQLNKLQELLNQVEKKEFQPKFKTPILTENGLKCLLKLLETEDPKMLIDAFFWGKTPQGFSYWNSIHKGESSLSKEDIQQIKDWAINYLITNRA